LNKYILNTGVQVFISNNLNADILSVLLAKPHFEGLSQKELAEQIEAKKKCKNKLPAWYNTPNIYYPKKLHIEQSSSEITAKYKAGIVSGKLLLDLTGGIGVDSYYFSDTIDEVVHCEWNKELHEIATYNYGILKRSNIHTHHIDGLSFLENTELHFDWIYLDPSRRDDSKKKVFQLSDCTPDISKNLELILKKGAHVLLKTSPLLDIASGMQELKNVREIHIVAVNNEVKELLWILDAKTPVTPVSIKTINLTKGGNEVFDFLLLAERDAKTNYSSPMKFLYEPNAAIMKSGAFKIIGNTYGVMKLHEHSHLYTSSVLVDFPGRAFEIIKQVPYNKNALKDLSIEKANITTRNFPESVATIRKRFKISDGGEVFLFFTTNMLGKRIVLQCKKV
jgi:16S rRNA G966 N2-methylase RsmD